MRLSTGFTLHYIHGTPTLVEDLCSIYFGEVIEFETLMWQHHHVPPRQRGAVWRCSNRAARALHSLCSLLLSLPPSSSLPRSFASLQWSQQYCRETCQPLWSSHQGRRGRERERERSERGREGGIEKERESTYRQSIMQQDNRGWWWRIWHLFHSWWNDGSAGYWRANGGVNEWRWESEWVTVNRERWGESEYVDDWVKGTECSLWSILSARIKKKKKKKTRCVTVLINHTNMLRHTLFAPSGSHACAAMYCCIFPPLLTQQHQATLMFSVGENVQYEAAELRRVTL